MIKGLIFDLDGTLTDITKYIPIFHSLQRGLLNSLNLSVEHTYDLIRLPLAESDKLLREHGWKPEDYWQKLSVLDLEERKKSFANGNLKFYDDVSVLHELKKKYVMAILTNTPEEITDFELNYGKLDDIFRVRVCSRYKGDLSKPETNGINKCLELMNLNPKEAVMVGDSDIDTEVAHRVGMKSIRIRNYYNYDGNPDFRILLLNELEGVLNKL